MTSVDRQTVRPVAHNGTVIPEAELALLQAAARRAAENAGPLPEAAQENIRTLRPKSGVGGGSHRGRPTLDPPPPTAA